jgi:hypothetical protein
MQAKQERERAVEVPQAQAWRTPAGALTLSMSGRRLRSLSTQVCLRPGIGESTRLELLMVSAAMLAALWVVLRISGVS